MFRLLLRFALLLTLLVALPIVLIRAQPYDDSDLRAFLIPPEGCPMPCFMGIRPGVTTVEEAIAILEGHEWVTNLVVDLDTNELYPPPNISGTITWEWSGLQPLAVDTLAPAQLRIRDSRTTTFRVPLNITFGQILLSLGMPDDGGRVGIDEDSTFRAALLRYTPERLAFDVTWYCSADAIWQPWHFKLAAKSSMVFTDNIRVFGENINMNVPFLAGYC
jgi:hypothetical protein